MKKFLAATRIGHSQGLGDWAVENLTQLAELCRNMISSAQKFEFVVLRTLNKSSEVPELWRKLNKPLDVVVPVSDLSGRLAQIQQNTSQAL